MTQCINLPRVLSVALHSDDTSLFPHGITEAFSLAVEMSRCCSSSTADSHSALSRWFHSIDEKALQGAKEARGEQFLQWVERATKKTTDISRRIIAAALASFAAKTSTSPSSLHVHLQFLTRSREKVALGRPTTSLLCELVIRHNDVVQQRYLKQELELRSFESARYIQQPHGASSMELESLIFGQPIGLPKTFGADAPDEKMRGTGSDFPVLRNLLQSLTGAGDGEGGCATNPVMFPSPPAVALQRYVDAAEDRRYGPPREGCVRGCDEVHSNSGHVHRKHGGSASTTALGGVSAETDFVTLANQRLRAFLPLSDERLRRDRKARDPAHKRSRADAIASNNLDNGDDKSNAVEDTFGTTGLIAVYYLSAHGVAYLGGPLDTSTSSAREIQHVKNDRLPQPGGANASSVFDAPSAQESQRVPSRDASADQPDVERSDVVPTLCLVDLPQNSFLRTALRM